MIKFRFFGDFLEASKLVHIARKQMNILKQSMEVSGLWTEVRKWSSEVTGAKITCWSIGGRDYADIFYPPTVVVKPEKVVLEEEEELASYKPYILIVIGNYVGTGDSVVWAPGDMVAHFYILWDVEEKEVVAGPCNGGVINAYFDGKRRDADASTGRLFKALAFGGDSESRHSLAYINAEWAELSDLECHLTVPQVGSDSCSDTATNVFGGTDSCSLSHSSFSSLSVVDGVIYTSNVTVNERESNCDVWRHLELAPNILTVEHLGTDAYNIPAIGGSLVLGDSGEYKVSVDEENTVRYNYSGEFTPGVGSTWTSSERTVGSKSVSIDTPIGVLFEDGPVGLSWNYTVTTSESGESSSGTPFVDIYEPSAVCVASYLESPNIGDDSVIESSLYFSQYNTYCETTGVTGDRKYDVIAGIRKGNVVSSGLGINKSNALTQAVKDLIDYYHANTYLSGLPLASNYVNDRLDLDIVLISRER
jgi:hypothetical protein